MVDESKEIIPTRRSLLSRLRSIDEQTGWREFFNTYWPLIYGVAKRAGLNEDEAQNCVQDTVVSVARAMPGFQYDSTKCSFKTWLHRITRRRIIDQMRKRSNYRTSEVPLSSECASEVEHIPGKFELDEVWEQEWNRNLLDRAMDRVKTKVRPIVFQMFYLYVVKQRSIKQVTRALEVSPTHVYVAKHRVAGLLRKEVKRLEKTQM